VKLWISTLKNMLNKAEHPTVLQLNAESN